jgi:hypothetical protein
MTYRRIYNMSANSGAETACPHGTHKFTLVCNEIGVTQSSVVCVVFCNDIDVAQSSVFCVVFCNEIGVS